MVISEVLPLSLLYEQDETAWLALLPSHTPATNAATLATSSATGVRLKR